MSALRKCRDKFTETEIDDEVVVMLLDSGEFLSMTETGPDIWRLIDGHRDRDAIVACLAAEFAADPADVGPDVDEFLDRLRQAGLVSS